MIYEFDWIPMNFSFWSKFNSEGICLLNALKDAQIKLHRKKDAYFTGLERIEWKSICKSNHRNHCLKFLRSKISTIAVSSSGCHEILKNSSRKNGSYFHQFKNRKWLMYAYFMWIFPGNKDFANNCSMCRFQRVQRMWQIVYGNKIYLDNGHNSNNQLFD